MFNMNKNLQSPTKLTEFAPLQSEEKQQSVGQFISKFFKLNKPSNQNEQIPTISENNDDLSEESLPTWALDTSSESSHSRNESANGVYPVDIGEGRSLPNVLKRISNLLALKSTNLQDYADTELKKYWMPDSVSKECYECCEKFTTFRRKHHCRVCGQIFCSQCCSEQIPGKIFGCTGDLRVCTYCCKVVLSYLQSSDVGADLTADLKLLQESLQNKYGISSITPSATTLLPNVKSTDSSESGGTLKRKISLGYQEENFASGRQSNISYLTTEEKCKALQNSTSLRNLYDEICRPTTGILLKTYRHRLRSYTNCFLGSELVDWLIYQQKANTRVQAAAISQALLEGGYIDCISDAYSFIDGYVFYKPGIIPSPDPIQTNQNYDAPNQDEPIWVQQIPQESSATDSENEQISPSDRSQGYMTSSSSYMLDLNVEANTVYLSRPPPSAQSLYSPDIEDDLETEKHKMECKETLLVRTSEQREFVPESGWHNATHLREENGEKMAYNLLTEVFKQHESNLMKQLLSVKGLSLHWMDTVVPLIHEIVDVIRPDKSHDAVDLDIRNYVQIKKISGGSRNDCKLINGIVCSKNIAHKGMAAKLENPKILLLQCSIVYQRTEGRLMSLNPVLMQEHEYLGHAVARIAALEPNIVLVHRTVSRLAQDLLRQQGITLIHNVKESILDRVARCTEADLVTNVDAHIGKPRLGTCKNFYLKTFDLEKGGSKTLMFFEGLPIPYLGGTVLLRGGLKSELKKLKSVLPVFLFACYNWRLEKSFLMDEYALPPNSKDEFFDDSKETSPILTTSETSIYQKDNLSSDKLFKLSTDESNKKNDLFSDFENDTDVFIKSVDTSVPVGDDEDNNKKPNKTKEGSPLHTEYTDPLHSYNTDDIIKTNGTETFSVAELPFSNAFRKALDDTILCISPYIVFPIPYLETELGKRCKLRQFFPNEIYYSKYFENEKKCKVIKEVDNSENSESVSSNKEVKPLHPFLTLKIRSSVDTNEIQCLLAHFRACGGRFEKKSIMCDIDKIICNDNKKIRNEPETEKIDVLDFNNHQKLAVLFCSFSHKSSNAPAFCVDPWVVYMVFYDLNDIPLGCFLERYCFRPTYSCQSKTCDVPMVNHIRRFVHNAGCVSLVLNSFENEFAEDGIVMWTWCSKCTSVSPLVPMSSDTWSFSFAKYLELKFHGGIYGRRGNTPCCHSLHHDHDQYFGYKNYVATFKYTSVLLWEISLPPAVIEINYDTTKHQNEMIDEIKTLALTGHEIFMLITKKLGAIPSDVDDLINFKQILIREQAIFKQKIEEVQLKLTSPTLESKEFNIENKVRYSAFWKIDDALVRIKRLIVDSVDQWNLKLSELTRKKDVDKKKEKIYHHETENQTTSELSDVEVASNQQNKESISGGNVMSKKIKSLDQSEASVGLANYSVTDLLTCIKRLQCEEVPINLCYFKNNVNVGEGDFHTFKKIRKNQSFPPHPQIHFTACSTSLNNRKQVQGENVPSSPKGHHRSQSDGTVMTHNEDSYDAKKDSDKKSVKTIFSQLSSSLIPSTVSAPIVSPFGVTEHYMLPTGVLVPIVVYENEPSSIVAYALNSFDYKKSFDELSGKKIQSGEQSPSPVTKRKTTAEKDRNEINDFGEKSTGLLSFLRNKDVNNLNTTSSSGSDTSQTTEQPSSSEKTDDGKKGKTAHIEVQFQDSNCNFFCRIYYAEKFAALRSIVLPIGEEAYIRSLSRSVQWNARGGKSGSNFAKTLDDRFILKEMSKSEVHLFLESAPSYFAYMQKCCTTAQPTLLGKIVGIYQIIFKNSSNITLRTNLLVMENLFYNRTVTQKFDLKGSMRNRLVNPDNQDGEIVLLDENLLKMTCDSPLYILPHSKAVLTAAIQNDTEFLSAQSVMDYSLLVGLDSENKELVLGIIDYIRTFTWDKKIETMVKKSGILGGQGKLPTIVSPEEYQKRFIKAMHRYFLEVPDHWAGLGKGLEC